MKASRVLLALSFLVSTAYSLNNNKHYPTITSLPNTQILIHHEPNINLSVTNYGILGPYGTAGPDTGRTVPGAGLIRCNTNIKFALLKTVNLLSLVQERFNWPLIPNNGGEL